jgi:cytoskeleton protein RodZ
MGVLLLVLATVVLLFWPLLQQSLPTQAASPPEVTAPSGTQGSQTGVAMAQPAMVEAAPVSANASVGPAIVPGAAPVPPDTLNASASTASAAAGVPVVATLASQPAPAGIILFKASGESWVEVKDAKGVVVLRRMLAAGDAAAASGVLPLTAVVGKVDVTEVQVRGQAFNLAPVSRDNVARFEVK